MAAGIAIGVLIAIGIGAVGYGLKKAVSTPVSTASPEGDAGT